MARALNINRRDFLNGLALGVAVGSGLAPLELLARAPGPPYPPLLTGMRGSHPGSFEVAHALAWHGAKFKNPEQLTDATYDLIVVGGGVSGLAAAHFYRQRTGPQSKILVLDNHDDFGGHAKRNEFEVDGQTLIGYGGSQSMQSPRNYSAAARKLLVDVGIHTERFYDYFDQDFFDKRKLRSGIHFNQAEYGADRTLASFSDGFFGTLADDAARVIGTYPISPEARQSFVRLIEDKRDYLSGQSRKQKRAWLRRTSYRDFLLTTAGVHADVYYLLRDTVRGYWGLGWDALSTLEAWRLGMPGTWHLGIGRGGGGEDFEFDEPYIFHFPDGNAGVARAIVRGLIPGAAPGNTMEDLVSARFDYGALDVAGSPTRIRLNSTAVRAHHSSDGKFVDVTYVGGGDVYRVRGKHAVLACYNSMLPHICPEMPEEQAQALTFGTRAPLVYISIAVRNWRAFAQLGFADIHVPKTPLMHSFGLDFPVSMGGYSFTQKPEEPTILHGTYVPTVPDQGLSSHEQHKRGRRLLYEMTWDFLEEAIVGQLQGALAPGGFDAVRDIAAITVNRWPHGYAYEYNELWDPPEYNYDSGPHVVGARRLGRMSIANSDAAGYAMLEAAIDAADWAVDEQLG